jgi:hypothetical protein
MARKSSHRAESIMRQTHSEERAGVRVPMHLSGGLKTAEAEHAEHVVLVRDISFHGVFFYSNFKPPVNSEIELGLAVPMAGKTVKIQCHGKVVRVEPSGPSAYGIAAKLHRCDFVPAA